MGRRSDYIIILTTIVLLGACLWPDGAAARGTRGLGYDEGIAAKSATKQTRPAPERSAAERRAIAVWGRNTGRWYDECRRYWPLSQMRNVMYCIKHESGGYPNAYNRWSGAKGLFQLVGYRCNVWPALTNIRLAHKLWLSRGWSPWSVM